MIELLFAAFAVATSIRIARSQPVSTVLHSAIAIGLMALAIFFIPIPYVRVAIAFALSFVAMTVDKARQTD